MKEKIILWFCVIYTILHSFTLNAFADTKYKNEILFIGSYNSSYPIFFQQIDGVRSVLTDEDSILDIEFMDSKRFPKDDNIINFYNLIKYKINNNPEKYDAIIVADDNAYDFAVKYENELFKNIPIVFLGINSLEKAISAKENIWVTGVAQVESIEDTLKVAIKIKPKATKVIAIGDSTETGIEDVKTFYNQQKHFNNLKFSDINLGDLTIDEFKTKLNNIDNNTIVVFIAAYRDKTGNPIDFEIAVKLAKDNCRQPLFSLQLQGVGSGLLGGKVVSHIEQGKNAAEIVKKILSGVPVQNIPVVDKNANKYVFDNNELEKFKISKNLLPKNSIIINTKITFYEKYKNYIWSVILIFVVMVFFIIYLLVNIRFRKKAEKDLIEANMELSATYEQLEASSEELTAQYDEIQAQDEILVHSKESYRLICEASIGGTWDFDLKTKERIFTESWYEKYGFGKENFENVDNWINKIHPEDKEIFFNYQRLINEGKEDKFSCEYRIQISNGEYRYFSEKCIVVHDIDGKIKRIAGSHTDVTDRKQQDIKIEKLAYHDILTGLPNRSYLNKEFKAILRNCDKVNFYGATIFMDLDNFRLINDFFGHETGDKVLIYISDKLKHTFEKSKKVFISKSSADEYIILIKEIDGDEEVKEYIKIIQKIFEEKFAIEDNELYITISMGIVIFPNDGITVKQLFRNADTALHKAKDSGKNCYKMFHKSMDDTIENRVLLQGSIREALENKEFVLYYQPQIDVLTGKLSGYEALIRWISPKHGFVRPDEFIKLAEENGTIVLLGKWVLMQACEFCKKINDNSKDKYTISVNISPIELMQYEFSENVKEIIKKSGVNPGLIEIEITESSLMESFDTNIEKLNLLKKCGLSIALDDFGTGYSSLNYLKQLPIDTLKIDKSFVDDMLNTNIDKNFVDIIIVLAHRMGLKVVAEGVETEKQKEVLKSYGCDTIQGYIFSKPLPEINAIEYKKSFLKKETEIK